MHFTPQLMPLHLSLYLLVATSIAACSGASAPTAELAGHPSGASTTASNGGDSLNRRQRLACENMALRFAGDEPQVLSARPDLNGVEHCPDFPRWFRIIDVLDAERDVEEAFRRLLQTAIDVDDLDWLVAARADAFCQTTVVPVLGLAWDYCDKAQRWEQLQRAGEAMYLESPHTERVIWHEAEQVFEVHLLGGQLLSIPLTDFAPDHAGGTSDAIQVPGNYALASSDEPLCGLAQRLFREAYDVGTFVSGLEVTQTTESECAWVSYHVDDGYSLSGRVVWVGRDVESGDDSALQSGFVCSFTTLELGFDRAYVIDDCDFVSLDEALRR